MPLPRRLTESLVLLAAVLSSSACVPEAATKERDVPAAALPTPTPTPVDHAPFIGAVDALAADALQQGPIAGLSIAVTERGATVLVKGYGSADLEAGVPAAPDTSYPIASVSKHFTAAAILRLADQGRLGLDDPLSRFFPGASADRCADAAPPARPTSGFTRGGPAPRAAAQNVLRRGGTARAQGDTWDYSNYNFSILGLVIEKVTGRDYAAYVHDELTAPLGLTGTGYCEDGSPVPGRTRDYLSGRKRVAPTPYWTKPHFFAAGGLCSTVVDLVRWEQALESGRVVSPAMLSAMRTPARLSDGLEADYGLGTRLGWTAGHRKVGHTGGGQGNKAVLARYPDDDVTVVVLLNTEKDDAAITANELEERIARLLFASAGAAPAGSAASAQGCAGQYRDGSRLVSVTAEPGWLTLRPGYKHRAQTRLVAGPGGAFLIEDDPTIELRFQMQDGEARSYARYRHGWFSGLAVRYAGAPAALASAPARTSIRPANR
jgi:CubicO group peptidase (beta-lactamase class C family)